MNSRPYSTQLPGRASRWLQLLAFVTVLVLFGGTARAQCTNATGFGTANVAALATGATATISTCSFQTEYSTINGAVLGNGYTFTIATGGYITVRSGSPTGPVILHGPSPLAGVVANSATLFPHWNVNAACATLSNCVNTSVTNNGPAIACSGTPTAGTITGPLVVCTGNSVTLTTAGGTLASGLTYQWNASSTAGGPYTNVGTGNTFNTGAVLSTTYYVCDVTCTNSGLSATTPEFTVTTIGVVPGGTFTIDNTQSTGGTNYNSFTDAINWLNSFGQCGAFTSPVTFNVIAGQSFNENPPAITATGSLANPIVFQKSGVGANPVITPSGGNGVTATADFGLAVYGGDFFTFDGININSSANTNVEFGYLIRNLNATNGCDNIEVENCTITLNRANTATTGLLHTTAFNGGGFTPTALSGTNNNCNYHDITVNNVALGGIFLTSGTATFPGNNNQVHHCTIGAPFAGTPLPDIGNATLFVSLYGLNGNNQSNLKFYNNTVQNMGSTTGTNRGIWVQLGQGTIEVYNNRVNGIRAFNSTTAIQRGMEINLSGTLGTPVAYVYNNHVSGLSSNYTGAATATRGLSGIFLGSAGVNSTYHVDYNNVSIDGTASPLLSNCALEFGGNTATHNVRNNVLANFTGAQAGVAIHLVVRATVAATIGNAASVLNFNDYFIANPANGFVAQGAATNYATTALWDAAVSTPASNDVNTLSVDPNFTDNAGNPTANASALDGTADMTGITWVTTDIFGAVRSAPHDRGANLISVCALTNPPGNTLSTAASSCPSATFTLSLQNGTLGSGVTYQWQSSPDNVTFTNIPGAVGSTLGTTVSSNTWFRCQVTCASSTTETSNPVQVLVTPFLNCYCASNATSTADEEVLGVTINGYTNTSTCATLAPGPGSITSQYSNYTTLGSVTNMDQGALIPFSLNLGTCGTGNFGRTAKIWIDFNQNGSFIDVGEEVAVVTYANTILNPQTFSGTFLVPIAATPGITRMRIVYWETATASLVVPCGTYTWGETEDYFVSVTLPGACVNPPNPGTLTASATAVCPGTTVNFTVTGYSSGSGQSYQWQYSPDNITYTPISGATNPFYNAPITLAGWYRMSLTCGATATTNAVQVTLNSFLTCYCTSNATSPADEEILNVTFGSLNNSSICNELAPGPGSVPSQYSNYTTSVTAPIVVQNQTVPFSVQVGTCNGNFNNWTKIWIDHNQNGLFTDAGEEVFSNATFAFGPNTQTGNITIPITAVPGQTRMRVVNVETTVATGVNPCGTYTWGETEDYFITINAAPPCIDPPSAGVSNGPVGIVCPGATITVINSGQDLGTGAAYQWQSSPDNVTYTNIPGQTLSVLSVLVPTTTWYRMSVTCGLSTTFSTPFLATTSSFSAPYFENFDSGVAPAYVPNNCWTRSSSNGTSLWQFANGTGNPAIDPDYAVENVTDHTSGTGYFAWYDGNFTAADVAYTSPVMNISALTVPYVRFFLYSNNTNDIALNTLALQAWNGLVWVNLGTYSGNFAGWQEKAAIVPPTIPVNTQFRLVANSGTGGGFNFYNDLLVDDFSVQEAPPCATPIGPVLSGITGTTATVSWTCPGCTGTYVVEYGPVGFTPGTGTTAGVGGTVITSASSPVILSGLPTGTAYQVYVRQDCLGNGTTFGFNAGPGFFTTAPGCGNVFYDSGGPLGQYTNNENNVFTICPNTAGDIVQLQFTSFQTESNWDPLYVFNGNSTTAPKIATTNAVPNGNNVYGTGGWWGTTAPTNTPTPGLVRATNATGCLTFAFTSDGSVIQNGWAANISCITPNLTCATASAILCGETKQGFTNGGPYNLPASACGFNGTPSSGGVAWYTYTALADNDVVVSTCGQASFDTRISVFAPVPDCSNLACIGGVDNLAGCPGGSTEMTFKATTGQTYYIAVHGVGTDEGTFSVSLFCVPVCAPGNANDLCANATSLSASLSGTGVPSTGENGCAYVDGPTACSSNLPVQGVWYSFNSGLNTQHTLTLLTSAQNPAYTATSVSYAVYNGACTSSGASGELTCYSGAGTSVLTLAPNTDYKLLVYNQGGVGVEGSFGVKLERPAIYDASISEVREPVGLLCDTKFDPVVRLKNLGEAPLTDVQIDVQIDGGAPVLTYLWNGFLAFGDSIDAILPQVTTPTGVHTLTVTATQPNGQADENNANNAASSVYNASGQTLKVRITTDNNGGETTWSIFDANFGLEASGGPYSNNTTVVETVCLSTAFGDQWSFFLFDSFGDGICCANGNGSWALLDRQDQLVLRDQGTFTTQSPSAAPQTPAYAIGHEVMLPLGPVVLSNGECGVFDNLLQNKVFVNPVAGVTNYQYEFSNPDAGFRRRVLLARNYVLFTDMQSNPLSLGVTYFLRARADQGAPGASDDNWGSGCEMAWSASAAFCTQLITTPGPTFSCGVTRTFGGSDKIWAQPVPGVVAAPAPGQPTPYQFRFTGTGSNSGYVRNIFRSSYICPLSWVTNPLVNGQTYDVQVQVWVAGAWKGFCGNTCQVTINNNPAQGGRSIAEETASDNVQLWPNPVRDGRVNLRIDGLADAEQNITVDVFDVFGKRVFTQEYGNSGELFNTVLVLNSDIATGLYMVNITVNDRTYTKRVSVL